MTVIFSPLFFVFSSICFWVGVHTLDDFLIFGVVVYVFGFVVSRYAGGYLFPCEIIHK